MNLQENGSLTVEGTTWDALEESFGQIEWEEELWLKIISDLAATDLDFDTDTVTGLVWLPNISTSGAGPGPGDI